MKGSRRRPRVQVRASASGLVSLAGVQLLVETAWVIGLDTALNSALSPWRTRSATHDPGTVLTHLAMGLAAGGDCPADVAALRAQPGLLGPVASDPTVSRLVHTLAGDPAALGAIRGARAAAHARLVDLSCPDGEGSEVVVDVDATGSPQQPGADDADPHTCSFTYSDDDPSAWGTYSRKIAR